MRVIAGTAKGRRLSAPPGRATRPTSDRVKEALFSSLQPRLPGARVLDLYAGSGALGIEALSRGAAQATFVERDARTVRVLEENLALTDCVGRATVLARDVLTVLRTRPVEPTFDLVLADPPYAIDRGELASVLGALVDHLVPGALVVVELATRGGPPAWPDGLIEARARRYGDTTLYTAEAGATA